MVSFGGSSPQVVLSADGDDEGYCDDDSDSDDMDVDEDEEGIWEEVGYAEMVAEMIMVLVTFFDVVSDVKKCDLEYGVIARVLAVEMAESFLLVGGRQHKYAYLHDVCMHIVQLYVDSGHPGKCCTECLEAGNSKLKPIIRHMVSKGALRKTKHTLRKTKKLSKARASTVKQTMNQQLVQKLAFQQFSCRQRRHVMRETTEHKLTPSELEKGKCCLAMRLVAIDCKKIKID